MEPSLKYECYTVKIWFKKYVGQAEYKTRVRPACVGEVTALRDCIMVKPGVHFHLQDVFALSDAWTAGGEGENQT